MTLLNITFATEYISFNAAQIGVLVFHTSYEKTLIMNLRKHHNFPDSPKN